VAERAARAAGEVLLSRFDAAPVGLEHKSSETDPVSEADREAERAVEEILAAERPDDGLLAEEGATSESENGRRWLVDPLDGTVNFLYGFPAWCVSVGLEDADGAAVGVVHDPLRRETFRAARGGGCELNGEPVRVRGRDRLETALIATGFSYDPDRRAEQAATLAQVLPRVRDVRRAGAAALDLAWVAAGRVDGYYERGGKPWDWAAGRLLVGEAGGAVSELLGEPLGLAAANPKLLPELVGLVT
jgi:myo-inositol-1(or 4)-monophosphatase